MKRLESLDVLRGLDMFMLTAFGAICTSFIKACDMADPAPLLRQFDHPSWTGFTMWDLIMPLFMFCSGVAIPYAMTKYRESGIGKGKIYMRIFRRVAVLWIFGMMCQGNLLTMDPHKFVYFSNTLQSIAVGYLASSLLFLHTRPKTQIIVASALLLGFWALMMFVRVDGFGGGDFTPQGNLAEWVDRTVLGAHCDHATVDEATGAVIFREKYNYTWVLSSMTFIVTVMTGMFAGEILKSRRTNSKKVGMLICLGAAMTAAGWIWNLQMPVIKHIWTSSMTLVASGYSFLLLALIYWIVDVRRWKWLNWLKVFGMNAIAAYMIIELFRLSSISKPLLYGLEQYTGEAWYAFIIAVANGAILWGILYLMYKRKVFLRV